jgi:hypothetical protein
MLGLLFFAIVAAAIIYVMLSPRMVGFRTKTVAWITGVAGGVIPAISSVAAVVLPYGVDITTYLKDLDWRQYVDPSYAPAIIIGMSVLFYVLRRMTTAPESKA